MEDVRPWKLLKQETVLETPWFKIRKQRMLTPSGKEANYYIHDSQDSVICVCVNDKDEVLIEKQYRPPIKRISIDYPAGKIEKDDASTEEAIRRELQEETGFIPQSLKKLAVIDKEPSFSKTRLHIFLAKGSIKGSVALDETENIISTFVKPNEVLDMISTGQLTCTFCISATFFVFRNLGWLEQSI